MLEREGVNEWLSFRRMSACLLLPSPASFGSGPFGMRDNNTIEEPPKPFPFVMSTPNDAVK